MESSIAAWPLSDSLFLFFFFPIRSSFLVKYSDILSTSFFRSVSSFLSRFKEPVGTNKRRWTLLGYRTSAFIWPEEGVLCKTVIRLHDTLSLVHWDLGTRAFSFLMGRNTSGRLKADDKSTAKQLEQVTAKTSPKQESPHEKPLVAPKVDNWENKSRTVSLQNHAKRFIDATCFFFFSRRVFWRDIQRIEFCLQTNQVGIKHSCLVEKAINITTFFHCLLRLWTETPRGYYPDIFRQQDLFPALSTCAMFFRAYHKSCVFPRLSHMP